MGFVIEILVCQNGKKTKFPIINESQIYECISTHRILYT